MKRFSLPPFRRCILAALVLMLALPWAVFADQVVNTIDTTIDPELETVTITAGGSASVVFDVIPSNTIPPGDASGCNATGSAAATMLLSVPAGVTASPTSLTFQGCGLIGSVSFSSSTVGSYTISVASVSGGKPGSLWDTAPAAFTLVVNPPSDTTPPVITPNVSCTLAGNAPWCRGTVTVSWTVTDPESTITWSSGCGTTTVSTDTGSGGQTFTCTATSAGGTSSQSVTVYRDGTPPTITASISPAAAGTGWYNITTGAPTVSFTCNDTGGSGLAGSCPGPVTLGNGAGQSVSGGPISDVAGNSSGVATISNINVDLIAPTILADISPAAAGTGWYNISTGAPTVSFTCADTGGSGLASACPAAVTLGNGAGQSVSGGPISDVAGNSSGVATISNINVDLIAPTISVSATANSSLYTPDTWTNKDVTVIFTCSDSGGSGLASCSAPVTLNTEGVTPSVSGTATDNAGNSASTSFGPVNIDKTPPTITITSPANDATYTLNQAVASDYSCADQPGLSGVATCSGPVPSGNNIDTSSVGSKAFTVNATDNAGNSASLTHNYSVIYNWTGFFRPVDNPPVVNVAKAGSAIPVKFSLSGYQGLDIFADQYPRTVAIACNGNAPTDAIEYTVTAGGSSLNYDASANQYVYVWKTEKAWAGTCRQLVVKLIDGTEHLANFNFTK